MSEINTKQSFSVNEQQKKNYLFPLTAMTTLFFMGFYNGIK
ncbi:hypothetical protein P20495_0709 [Pseudoalteromonas sp. BSi20495]|nr:hypothetical protein P20495_0709 [Pseudoalteromonas sp. BSi20495]